MIELTLAAILAQTPTKDKSLSDLATSMSSVAKRSAIAVAPSNLMVSLPDDPKVTDDIVDPLRKDGFSSLISDVAVVYQTGIPKSHWGVLTGLVAPNAKPDPAPQYVDIPATAVKDNKITFATKGNQVIKVGNLGNLNLAKRISISPYFNFDGTNDFPVAISANEMMAADFARALAKGLGGKFSMDAKNYTISFDAQAFRNNMTKLIALAVKGVDEGKTPTPGSNRFQDGGSYEDYQEYQIANQPAQSSSKTALKSALTLLGQTINQMTDQLLEQTFAYKGTSTRLNLATFTNLQNPSVSYLQAAAPTGQNGADVRRPNPGGGGGATNTASLIRRVNPQNPGHLIITTDFRLSLELNVGGNRRNRPNNSSDIASDNNTVTIQVL